MISMAFELLNLAVAAKGNKAGVNDALVESVVRRVFDHEERKSSVRPQMMKNTGRMTIGSGLIIVGLSIAHAFGYVAWDALQGAATVIGGVGIGSGSLYGYGHGTRTVEKMKGAA